MIQRISLFLSLFFLTCTSVFAQMSEYAYKCELTGIENQWHKLVIPEAIFGKVSENMNDIRIYGITLQSDTIEAPYILKKNETSTESIKREFNLINKSFLSEGSFFTFETPSSAIVNTITLNFRQDNYEWRIQLEGSHDQLNWYTICNDYRILSIQNDQVAFTYSEINFSPSTYRYYRIFVKSTEKPELISASLVENKTSSGNYNWFQPENLTISQVKDKKETCIDFNLKQAVPVSSLKIQVTDPFDYYRPVKITYVTDSTKTENGLKYHYALLTTGILNSFGENEFTFNSVVLQKVRILVENTDNQPLTIKTVEVKGPVYELFIRFTGKADYYLVYGNRNALRPQYDLERFQEKIPENPAVLVPGNEIPIIQHSGIVESPLFINKFWLWTIMLVIILLLGWFSLMMIKKK